MIRSGLTSALLRLEAAPAELAPSVWRTLRRLWWPRIQQFNHPSQMQSSIEVLNHSFPSIGSQAGTKDTTMHGIEQLLQSVCQRNLISGGHEQAAMVMFDQFRNARNVRGHHRQANGHGFHQDIGDTIAI